MKTHEINLKIQDESELYLTLDPYQNTLSQEIVDYLTRVTLNMHGKSNDRYIINVISDTPIDEQHAASCIRGEIVQKKKDSDFLIKN